MLKVSAKLRIIKLKITSFAGDYHYYYFAIILLLISFKYYYFILFLIAYMIKLRRKINLKFLIIILVILGLSITTNYIIKEKISNHIVGNYRVIQVKEKEAVIKKGFHKYIIKGNFIEGEGVFIEGDLERFPTNNTINGFNPNEYYLSQNIYGKITNYKIINRNNKLNFSFLRIKLIRYIDNFTSPTKEYLNSLILGDSSFLSEEKALLSNFGLAYLVGLSGIHLYIVISFFKKIFFYLDIKDSYQVLIIGFIYLIFLYLTVNKFVVVRLFLFFVLHEINKFFKLRLTKLDIISIIFFIFIVANPYLIYSFGFKISFLIMTFLTLSSKILKSRYKILTSYKYFILTYLVSIPLQITINNEVNLMVLLISPLIVVLFKYFLIPLVLFSFIFPIINLYSNFFLDFIYKFLNLFVFASIKINLPDFSIVQIVIYIILLSFIMKGMSLIDKVKRSLIFVFFIVLIALENKIDPRFKVIFLDVYQGDTTIITSPFNGETIVIDAYGNILETLKSLNLIEIDYLILSHEDDDHTREAQNLIDNLNVKEVIINPYGTYKLNHPKIEKFQTDDYLNLKYFNIEFFGPVKNYYDNNDNSLVFKILYQDVAFLFTGDISQRAELDLVEKYGFRLKANYLKVPHHGSKTSSSQNFLEIVNPEYAIMFYAKNNLYGFPNQEVINRYKTNNIILFETAKDQTLIYDSSANNINTLYFYQKKFKYSIMN